MSNATSDTACDTTSQQSISYTPNQTRAKSRIPETEISPFKLNENLVNEIGNDEERIKSVIFKKYYGYQNLSFRVIVLFKANQVRNNQIVNHFVYSTNEVRNAVIKQEIPENVNQNKINEIIEKVLQFNNQQKQKGLMKHYQQLLRK